MKTEGLMVSDVMLRHPKTLPGGASVGEVRVLLERPSVQMVLLADDGAFRGAIAELPDDAVDDQPALRFADTSPTSLRPDDDATTAFTVTEAHPHRRVVVLDEGNALVGLVCLDETRTRFCGGGRGATSGEPVRSSEVER
jgi:CBS domain-containing protein